MVVEAKLQRERRPPSAKRRLKAQVDAVQKTCNVIEERTINYREEYMVTYYSERQLEVTNASPERGHATSGTHVFVKVFRCRWDKIAVQSGVMSTATKIEISRIRRRLPCASGLYVGICLIYQMRDTIVSYALMFYRPLGDALLRRHHPEVQQVSKHSRKSLLVWINKARAAVYTRPIMSAYQRANAKEEILTLAYIFGLIVRCSSRSKYAGMIRYLVETGFLSATISTSAERSNIDLYSAELKPPGLFPVERYGKQDEKLQDM